MGYCNYWVMRAYANTNQLLDRVNLNNLILRYLFNLFMSYAYACLTLYSSCLSLAYSCQSEPPTSCVTATLKP